MVQLCSLGLVIQEQAAGLDHDSPTAEYVGNGPEACVFILPFSMRKEYSWPLFVERTIDLWSWKIPTNLHLFVVVRENVNARENLAVEPS